MQGYGTICGPINEGVGDAGQLDMVYSTIYNTLYSCILTAIPSMHDLVTGKRKHVEISIPDRFNRKDRLDLTLKFMLGEEWMAPGYNPVDNTITILIRPWLRRANWPFQPNSVLPVDLGRQRFIRDMEHSLSYELKHLLDAPSICRLLSHELIHYYDYGTMPDMMRRDSAPDKFEQSRNDRIANPTGNYSGRNLEWVRDHLFPPVYVTTNFTGSDHYLLKRIRESFGPNDYYVYIHRAGTPDYDNLIKMSNLYKHRAYLSSIPEIRARIAEQLPWLLTRRKSNSDILDVRDTVRSMMDHVFMIPGDGSYVPSNFASLDDYRAHQMQKAMPDARRSVMKRLAKLVMAVNQLDIDRTPEIPRRLSMVRHILAKDARGKTNVKK